MSDAPDNFATFEGKCPVCGIKLFLKYDTSCPMDWVERLAKRTACNRCGDIVNQKREAFEQIGKVAAHLEASRLWGKGIKEEAQKKLHAMLVANTKKLADGLRKYYGCVFDYWQEDVVEGILKQPKNWFGILTRWRSELSRACRKEAEERRETDRLRQQELLEQTTGNKT